jgi:Leucine-rich repeat (LRR) protein
MAILRGLNVQKALIDIDNPDISLANLGLRIEDLDLLRNTRRDFGLSTADFHQIAGLTDNQNRLFRSQLAAAETAGGQTAPMREIDASQDYNFSINDRVIAGAIKYKYVDYVNPNQVPIEGVTGISTGGLFSGSGLLVSELDNLSYTLRTGDVVRVVDSGSSRQIDDGDYTVTGSPSDSSFQLSSVTGVSSNITNLNDISIFILKKWPVKSADISTSRVSSWSPIGPASSPDSYITYGGQVVLDGEYLAATKLGVTTKPEPKRYRAEVPTHSIRMNINGNDVTFPAIKGIPFQFDITGTRYWRIRIGRATNVPLLTDSDGSVPATIRRYNDSIKPTPIAYRRDVVPTTSTSGSFVGENISSSHRHKLEVYYPPKNIGTLWVYSSNIKSFPFIKLENLTHLRLYSNQFKVIPDLKFIAPSLQYLNISNNPLFAGYQYLEDMGLSHLEGVYTATESQVDNELLEIVTNEQFQRLPLSLSELNATNCFKGDINIDYSHLTNLDKVNLNASRYATNVPRLTGTGSTPIGPDPVLMVTFNPESTSQFLALGSGPRIIMLNNKFQDGDVVKYDYHVDATGTMGSALGGLDATVSNPNKLFLVANVNGDAFDLQELNGNTITTSSWQSSNGNLHSLTKWDQNTDDVYRDPNIPGMITDPQDNLQFRFLSRHIANSPRLTSVDLNTIPIQSLNKTPYVDDSTYDNLVKSNNDRRVYFFSDVLSSVDIEDGRMNVIDFSNKERLQKIDFENWYPDKSYIENDRVFDASKVSGCSSLYYIRLYQCGGGSWNGNFALRGDLSGVPGTCPQLSTFTIAATGSKFIINDQTFANNTRIGSLTLNGWNGNAYSPLWSNFSSDYFAISGKTGATGKAFDTVVGSLRWFSVGSLYSTGKRLYNDDNINNIMKVPLDNCSSLYFVYMAYSHWCGKLPPNTFNGKGSLRYIRVYNNKGNRSPYLQTMVEGAPYKIAYRSESQNNINRNAYGYLSAQEWIDMGWQSGVSNDSLVPHPESKTSHGSIPNAGDIFIAQHQGVECITPGLLYQIKDLGTNTGSAASIKDKWIRLGWQANFDYANLNDNGNHPFRGRSELSQGNVFTYEGKTGDNPQVGDFFRPPYNKTDLARCTPRSLINGVQYEIITEGSSPNTGIRSFSNAGASSNLRGHVFTANSFATNFNSDTSYDTGDRGRVARRHNPSESFLDGLGDGKVMRAHSSISYSHITNLGFIGELGLMNNLGSLTELKLYGNSFTGSFPSLSAQYVTEISAYNNEFTGDFPNLTGCPSLRKMKISNNNISNYVAESLSQNKRLSELNLQNNKLPASCAADLINDLWLSSRAAEGSGSARKNVKVYLKNQTPEGFSAPYVDADGKATRLSKLALSEIPGREEDETLSHPYNRWDKLVKTYNWTIDLDDI